jgi:hypothetical protein
MTPRADRFGDKFIVIARANEWDLWRAVNRARIKAREKAAALVAQAKAESKPEYFDDGWAGDVALGAENPRVMESDNLPFLEGIRAEAVSRGYDADWGRAEGSGRRYRLEVWDCGREEFSAILEAASAVVAHAVAA